MFKRARQIASVLFVVPLFGFVLIVPAPAYAQPNITEYTVPTNSADPGEIASGSDGALWFTEPDANKIGRINVSGQFTEYSVPSSNSSLGAMVAGPDDALWFGELHNVARITTGGDFTEFSRFGSPNTGTVGPDGALWFTSFGQDPSPGIIRFTTAGVMTSYILPGGMTANAITTGPDGALWFVSANEQLVGRINTSGVFLNAYTLPSTTAGPWRIVAGPDGALWFTEYGYCEGCGGYGSGGNKIGRITVSGDITEYSLGSSNASPYGITVGPDGALWFTEQSSNKIGRIDSSGHISEYSLPTPNSGPVGIVTGPDGALWFTERNANKIGRITTDISPGVPSLSAASPVQNPSLHWSTVSDAVSYNIYRSGTYIDSTTNTTYLDNSAPEGTQTYHVTAVNVGGESSASNNVNVLVDRTLPNIDSAVSPLPNAQSWNNTPATVTYTCTDNAGGSGIASCSSPQAESADGSYALAGTAVDNAGNTQTTNVTVNIDQTAPTVSNPMLAANPLNTGATTTLSATVSDNLSGVSRVEYYEGSDPGLGNAAAMTLASGTASATVGPYATAGTHTFYIRDRDVAGNWSQPVSAQLHVIPSQVLSFQALATASRNVNPNSNVVSTLASSVTTGKTLFVSVMTGTFSGAVACYDSAGNTYAVIADKNTGNGRLFICSANVTTQLNSGDTVTATYPGFSGLSVMSVNAIGGLDTPGQIDGASVTAAGSNPPVNSGSVAPSNVKAVIVGAVSNTNTATFTPSSGYTVLGQVSAGTGVGKRTITPVYQIITTPGSYSLTGSLSGSGFWQAAATDYLATGAQ